MSDTEHQEDAHGSLVINNKKLLMWLFLGSDCMFFGTLISTHLIYRKLYPESYDPLLVFDLELTSFSTFILLMSSFLMALAVSAMHKGELKSFRHNTIGVIFFGLIFLGCQVYEFAHFTNEGLTLSTNTFGSTFYMMTGTHGVHVAIGVFWLICLYFYSYTGKMDAHESAVDVEVAGLYWHFVDIVWIIIFTAVYLIEYIPGLH
jgi:heme/copper-type cytochrome/quinol oxidase subunit 3